jgi:glycosidase
MTDSNDIPRREAFEWYAKPFGTGMALWYKETGPWWDQTNLKADDGISFEEQKEDPASLWYLYRNLIALRENNTAIQKGSFQSLDISNDTILSFIRRDKKQQILVVLNLNQNSQVISLDIEQLSGIKKGTNIFALSEPKNLLKSNDDFSVELDGFDIQAWNLK